MKRAYVAWDLGTAEILKEHLEEAGVACMVWMAGRSLPQLWVEDEDVERAQQIVATILSRGEAAPAWRCPKCREDVDGEFEICWNCGGDRSGAGR